VHDWQDIFVTTLGHRLVFAADEYYLMTGRPFPDAATYEGFPMYEDGVGMVRQFTEEFEGRLDPAVSERPGFFEWVDAAPAEGYRAPRAEAPEPMPTPVRLGPRRGAPVGVLTGVFGAQVLGPLVDQVGRDDVSVLAVDNQFFGGNIGVSGLLVGSDLERVLAAQPATHRFLLPDVCLTEGRFLDGMTPDELPRPVEVIPTDGAALRAALGR
jgi:NifB/MoaA-like Fe-S oxidoreductase